MQNIFPHSTRRIAAAADHIKYFIGIFFFDDTCFLFWSPEGSRGFGYSLRQADRLTCSSLAHNATSHVFIVASSSNHVCAIVAQRHSERRNYRSFVVTRRGWFIVSLFCLPAVGAYRLYKNHTMPSLSTAQWNVQSVNRTQTLTTTRKGCRWHQDAPRYPPRKVTHRSWGVHDLWQMVVSVSRSELGQWPVL